MVSNTSYINVVTVVTPTDRPKSARNLCVIEHFDGVLCYRFVLCSFSVGIGAFVNEKYAFHSDIRHT